MKNYKCRILITGVAGFIGCHLAKKLISEENLVVGLDNINDYYSISLKKDRLKFIEAEKKKSETFRFYKVSLEDNEKLRQIFNNYNFDIVINLAAQAGVRYSLQNPSSYIKSNIVGFSNILEFCKDFNIKHLIYASSSSVYGLNSTLPFDEDQNASHPASLYAATKKSNELMAHSYSHLYNLPCTGLRFFTVYGPWGRPDMAPMIFARAILDKKPIDVFNYGEMSRDFTFIDDVIEAISRCCHKIPTRDEQFDGSQNSSSFSSAPYRIFNIGNNKPISLNYFIELLEKNLQKKAIKNFMSSQPGDLTSTFAEIDKLSKWIGYHPKTKIEQGIKRFTDWYIKYYSESP